MTDLQLSFSSLKTSSIIQNHIIVFLHYYHYLEILISISLKDSHIKCKQINVSSCSNKCETGCRKHDVSCFRSFCDPSIDHFTDHPLSFPYVIVCFRNCKGNGVPHTSLQLYGILSHRAILHQCNHSAFGCISNRFRIR